MFDFLKNLSPFGSPAKENTYRMQLVEYEELGELEARDLLVCQEIAKIFNAARDRVKVEIVEYALKTPYRDVLAKYLFVKSDVSSDGFFFGPNSKSYTLDEFVKLVLE